MAIRYGALIALAALLAACGSNPSTTAAVPQRTSGCSDGQTAYVDVNNLTGAYASLYSGGGQFMGSASPGRSTWRLPANTGYAYVGGETPEPLARRHNNDKPDVKFSYRCE